MDREMTRAGTPTAVTWPGIRLMTAPRADNGPRADVNLRYDGRSDSDVRSFPDFHSAGKRRAR